MTRARDLADLYGEGEQKGRIVTNEDSFEGDLIVAASTNSLVAGPVTIPNVTINNTASLQVAEELRVTNSINIIGNLNILS